MDDEADAGGGGGGFTGQFRCRCFFSPSFLAGCTLGLCRLEEGVATSEPFLFVDLGWPGCGCFFGADDGSVFIWACNFFQLDESSGAILFGVHVIMRSSLPDGQTVIQQGVVRPLVKMFIDCGNWMFGSRRATEDEEPAEKTVR